tara:strand:- start:2982 stop:3356 length:375 start_codon:yes stop_codon:yes gene_type:complete
VKFLNDFTAVQITFSGGNSIVVKESDLSKKSIQRTNMDDGIHRTAYEMSALIQTSHLPRSIICPITKMPLCDPVICSDGYSYERSEIQKWFEKSSSSPYTGKKLVDTYLIPNHALRNTITEIMK